MCMLHEAKSFSCRGLAHAPVSFNVNLPPRNKIPRRLNPQLLRVLRDIPGQKMTHPYQLLWYLVQVTLQARSEGLHSFCQSRWVTALCCISLVTM